LKLNKRLTKDEDQDEPQKELEPTCQEKFRYKIKERSKYQDDTACIICLEVVDLINNNKHTVWHTNVIFNQTEAESSILTPEQAENLLILKMVGFLREVQNCRSRIGPKKNIIFHCEDGVSLAGVILLADMVLQELTDRWDPVEPVQLLEALQIVRPNFLPNGRFLKYVYRVLSEYLGNNERYI